MSNIVYRELRRRYEHADYQSMTTEELCQALDSSGIADPYERWARTFSISVQWRSIGMFKNNIRVNELDELVLE